MLRRLLLLPPGIASCVSLLCAQSAPPQTTTQAPPGVIVGQVIDAGTGRHVPNARVSLLITGAAVQLDGMVYLNRPANIELLLPRLVPGPGPGRSNGPLLALTNGDGRFILRPVPKGTYAINATAT